MWSHGKPFMGVAIQDLKNIRDISRPLARATLAKCGLPQAACGMLWLRMTTADSTPAGAELDRLLRETRRRPSEVSLASGLDRGYVRKLIVGAYRNPRVETIRRIAIELSLDREQGRALAAALCRTIEIARRERLPDAERAEIELSLALPSAPDRSAAKATQRHTLVFVETVPGRGNAIEAQRLLCTRLQSFGKYSCARLYGERDMVVRLSAPQGRLADEFFDQSIYRDPELSRLVLRTTTNYLRDDLDNIYEVRRAPAPELQSLYRYALVLFRAASAFDREELIKRIGHAAAASQTLSLLSAFVTMGEFDAMAELVYSQQNFEALDDFVGAVARSGRKREPALRSTTLIGVPRGWRLRN
jgi:hypothetical protein